MKSNFYILLLNVIGVLIYSQPAPKEKPFNLKIVPSRMNKLSLDDLDQIKMEVMHDMNSQLKELEDEMAEKERLKEKTSSTWAMTGAPIYIPRNANEPAKTIPLKNKKYMATDGNNKNEEFLKGLGVPSFKELEKELQEADTVLEELKRIKILKELEKKKKLEKKVQEIKIDVQKTNSTSPDKKEESNSNTDIVKDMNKKLTDTLEPFEKELKKVLNFKNFDPISGTEETLKKLQLEKAAEKVAQEKEEKNVNDDTKEIEKEINNVLVEEKQKNPTKVETNIEKDEEKQPKPTTSEIEEMIGHSNSVPKHLLNKFSNTMENGDHHKAQINDHNIPPNYQLNGPTNYIHDNYSQNLPPINQPNKSPHIRPINNFPVDNKFISQNGPISSHNNRQTQLNPNNFTQKSLNKQSQPPHGSQPFPNGPLKLDNIPFRIDDY